MGEEFDESVDTSSFDDVSSDFSDTDSFSEPMDVGDIMDDVPSEPIETYDLDSIDSSFEEDISSPETLDVANILDDSAAEITSDDTFSDVQDSSFMDSSDIPTETEDFEQDAASDIADLMDEASIDDTPNDITESTEVSEVSEDNIESIMDDAEPLSDTIEENEDLISSDMNDNVTEIDSLMDAEDPAQQDVVEEIADVSDDSPEDVSDVSTILDSNDIGDTVTDGETNDNPSETTDLSDVDIEETEDVVVPDESQEIFEETSIDENTEDTDIDNSDISDDSQQITEDIGDVTEESEISEDSPLDSNASAYDQLAAYYSSHNYGQQDYAEYSQDPEWQELNNAYLQEIGQEPIDYGSDTTTGNSPIDSDASAYDQLAAYYSSHNYGQQDYAEYSQDPEWQELNNAYLQEIGKEPIDYASDSIAVANENLDENAITDRDITGEVEEIQPIENLDGWLKDINPNFDAFDVDSPYCNNCGSCAYAVYQRLEGNPDICATAENIGYNSEMEALTGMEQVAMTPQEIEQRLLEQGSGSHAIIGIDRAEGPGHWFNAANIDGKVVAIDGQDGSISDWPPDYGNVVNWEMSIKKE